MLFLSESEVSRNPGHLTAAWRAPETFGIIPDKFAGDAAWLESAAARIPGSFLRHHFVMLTSGSTGTPKLIVGSRSRAETLVQELHDRQASEGARAAVCILPLSYTYSFVNQWLWCHVYGRSFIPTTGLSQPAALSAVLADTSESMLCMVGVQVPLLLGHVEDAEFPGVVRLHFAGGRFPQERLPALRRIFPRASIFNNYGCAEAMPRLTIRGAEAHDEAANVGFPLTGVEMRCGTQGEILFRSPYRAIAVVENDVCHEIADAEWLATGDLGSEEGDGSWRLHGRATEVFKRHGEKVSLATLATTVHDAWPGQAVFYRERDASGEDGCVLVLVSTTTDVDVKPLLMALRKHHPRAHWPLRIESVKTLPVLPSGKPDVSSLAATPARAILWRQFLEPSQ